LANAHVASLKKGLVSSESIKIYNVGTGKGASVLDVVTAFEKVSNQKLNYEFGPRREGDVPEIYSDNGLIKNELGWNAKFLLEDCLEHSWKWEKNLVNFKYKSEKKQY
jgi:UDP-glucose 4-epimerase